MNVPNPESVADAVVINDGNNRREDEEDVLSPPSDPMMNDANEKSQPPGGNGQDLEECPMELEQNATLESHGTSIGLQQVRSVLYGTQLAMCGFCVVLVILSLVGLFLVIPEWQHIEWTRKFSNFAGIALWGGLLARLLFRYKYRTSSSSPPTGKEPPTSLSRDDELVHSLAFLRNTSWVAYSFSLVTGIVLAAASLTSCGTGFVAYFFLYHITGFLGAAGSLIVWFALPGRVVRSGLVVTQEDAAGNSNNDMSDACTTTNRHLRPVRKWVVVLVTVVALVLPWAGYWIFAFLAQSGPVDATTFPERASSPYMLPFPEGVTIFTAQGKDGLSHGGKYAYDFMAACGTPVVAARGGTVVAFVIDSYDGNIFSGNFENNGLAIQHNDDEKTTAGYYHIQKGSALVRLGDTVTQGQPIAKVGNVGFSCGPHLHFEVFSKVTWSHIPVSFQDVTKDQGIPRVFRSYTSGNVPS